MSTAPVQLALEAAEHSSVNGLVDSILESESLRYPLSFAERAHLYAHELPRRVREAFLTFKYHEHAPAILVKNNPDFGSGAFPTPAEIPQGENSRVLTRDEILHILYASLLGDVFTWDSIQHGNLINHVVPIEENADLPISSGSHNLFDLHTEDAFHPNAGEYFGLYCIRNEERAPTIISYIQDVNLTPRELTTLSMPRYRILPNIAHSVSADVKPQPILHGNPAHPFVRANFNAIDRTNTDIDAAEALQSFRASLAKVIQRIVMEPADALYIDNLRTLHGREPYIPSYGRSGRWLKRIYITTNLKSSSNRRSSPDARIVHAE